MITRLSPLTDQQSLQERTYQALRAALVDGDYLPGERLYEAAIAQALGVSRNPVREAVRRLQQDGLLEVRPHYGIYVTSIPPEEIEDVYHIRAALEATAARLAAERMTDEEVAELGAILEAQFQSLEKAGSLPREPVSATQADQFHHAIHVGARSPRLMALLEQIYAQVTHFRNLTLRVPGRAAVSAEGHATIYDAIRQRRADDADRLMRLHIDDARQALVRQLRDVQAEQPSNDGKE